MTGRGPARRTTGRGAREEAEVEDLPALPVSGRRGTRPGVAAALGAAAVIVLLAAGFGVLGGRPATVPPGPATSASGLVAAPRMPRGTPAVTPWIECSEVPADAPGVQLQVNGIPHDATVDLVAPSTTDGPPTPHAAGLPGATRIDVPVDVITEIWIVGGACATAWQITLGSDVLEFEGNPFLDPSRASQNRFGLRVAPYAGLDLDLEARLEFPTLSARATWPVRIGTLLVPEPMLEAGGAGIPLVPGCDVTLQLGNGWEQALHACRDDLSTDPPPPSHVGAAVDLEFSIPGWDVGRTVAHCGTLSGMAFIAEPEPGCEIDGEQTDEGTVVLRIPEQGTGILAISGCGYAVPQTRSNVICGTWFAHIDVGG